MTDGRMDNRPHSSRTEIKARAVLVVDDSSVSRLALAHYSSSENLGATILATLSTRLEKMSKSGNLAGAPELVAQLQEEYQRVCQVLKL